MDIDYILQNHRKELRKLNILRKTISNLNNFLIPETMAEYRLGTQKVRLHSVD